MKKTIALGYFDCLHKGHRYLLDIARKKAQETMTELFVSTFEDGFFVTSKKEKKEIYLQSERKEIFTSLGYNHILVFPSNQVFLSYSKHNFLDYLMTFDPAEIVAGIDYRFGKNAEGTVNDLQEYFFDRHVGVTVCDLYRISGEKVSSECVRQYLLNGQIAQANTLLSDPFFYMGSVRQGRHVGTKIGFPTLNIVSPAYKIRIKSGVYVTRTDIEGKMYTSVTNVGGHPTFNDDDFNIETYAIGYHGDAYDKIVKVYFYDYIREIIHFSSPNELSKRIEQDIQIAKRYKGFLNDD